MTLATELVEARRLLERRMARVDLREELEEERRLRRDEDARCDANEARAFLDGIALRQRRK